MRSSHEFDGNATKTVATCAGNTGSTGRFCLKNAGLAFVAGLQALGRVVSLNARSRSVGNGRGASLQDLKPLKPYTYRTIFVLLVLPSLAAGVSAQPRIQKTLSAIEIKSLPSPECISHPEKKVCKLDSSTLQRREQEVINRQWNLVSNAIPELQTATLVRPFESDSPEKNALYKDYCEVLRVDLLQGRYKVFRKPDVASSQGGIGKLVAGFSAVENQCTQTPATSTYARNALQGDWGFDGGRWLYRLTNGFAVVSFDIPTSTFWLDYEFDACNNRHVLPMWPRKGKSKEFSRTDVVGMTVIERGERNLIGLEYLEVHGNADGYNRNEYNGALQPSEYQSESGPVPRGMITIDGKQVIPWRGGAPIQWDPPPPSEPPVRFIGAFMAPPPWDSIYPELKQEAAGQPMHNEPCLWKLSH